MRSHTVPRKLLDLFAYNDPVSGTRRLWRFARERQPERGISPRSATRIDGHFADPANAEREARLEERLNQEFEDPVHRFIDQLRFRTFVLSRSHVRQLTRYVSLLFNRTQARRGATRQHIDVILKSIRSLRANEDQLSRLAGRWTLEMIRLGHQLQTTFTTEDVRRQLDRLTADIQSSEHEQTTYVDSMERAMANLDETMDNGIWNVMHTSLESPFVIGDAPVITWERNENNFLIYGQGFARPNVEVLLPVGPTTCLHILPQVARIRPTRIPTPQEVNEAQAEFATQFCFAHTGSQELNAILQPRFGRIRIGVNAFSVRHRNYSNTLFQLLMSGGNNFNAPPI